MAILGKVVQRAFKTRNRITNVRRIDPWTYQQKTFRRLLKKASGTAFGRHYQFKKILRSANPVKAFQETVPFFDYDSIHDQWWHRALNNEENVCWKGKVKYFALSSGTSGAPSKHLPITDDILRSNRRAGVKMFFCLTQYDVDPGMYTRGMMMLGGSTDLKNQGGYYVGDLSGINLKNRPFYLRKMYKPGHEIAGINDWNDRIDRIVQEAPNWDIGFIMGIPAWNMLMIERIIDHYKVDTIHDIWPGLSVYVHGGVAFEPYRKSFERLTAKPLHYMDTYLASEGFFAFQARPGVRGMALVPNNGIFFEFIPFNDSNFDDEGNIIGNPRALTLAEVEENVDYALIISTNAGTWRYLIGDTVRFTNKTLGEIIITGRTKHFLSICGEHLSIDNMNTAIQAVEEELDIVISEFTVAGVPSGKFFAHQWYIGCDEKVDHEAIRLSLDRHLRRVNDDYGTERDGGVLDMFLEVIPSRFFVEWFAQKNKLGGQSKFPRVLKKNVLKEWQEFMNTKAV